VTAEIEQPPAAGGTGRRWLRDYFALRGLAFMLDRPFAAMRAEAAKLLGRLLLVILGLAVLLGLVFIEGVWQTGDLVGRTDKITHKVNTWHGVIVTSWYLSLGLVALVALALIVMQAGATVREWSRIGNSMAVMLGFVALSFFSSDAWHVAGVIAWWRLATLVIVLSVLAFPLLCRQAVSTVSTVLEAPISTEDIARSIKDPVVSELMGDPEVLANAARIPRLARMNLCFIAAILLARRILLGGLIVSAALLLLGMIVISEQSTSSLMNNASVASIGFSRSFGFGSDQFFLSEPLLKVSLLLGVIAAGYFVFANPDPDDSADLVVPKFIRKMIVLRGCYAFLSEPAAELPGQPGERAQK
jgi:hypothetical protein